MRNFEFSRVVSLSSALTEHAGMASQSYVAGGTNLIDLIKLDIAQPQRLLDINHVGLNDIEVSPDGTLRIGALVRNAEFARHPAVRAAHPVVAEAILSGASSQLRNRATTGGNLLQRTRCTYFRDGVSRCNKRAPGSGCDAWEGLNRTHAILGGSEHCIATHPSDLCVALAAIDASVQITGVGGDRTLSFESLHRLPGSTPHIETALQPGDLITAVTLPAPMPGARSWYLKLRDRASFEFALASAAVVLRLKDSTARIEEARIALGGVATKPWRCREAEEYLKGRTAETAAFREAAELALKDATPREHNRFKIELAKRVIERALTLVARGQPSVRNT